MSCRISSYFSSMDKAVSLLQARTSFDFDFHVIFEPLKQLLLPLPTAPPARRRSSAAAPGAGRSRPGRPPGRGRTRSRFSALDAVGGRRRAGARRAAARSSSARSPSFRRSRSSPATRSGGTSARLAASRRTGADSRPSRSSSSSWATAARPSTGWWASAHSSPCSAGFSRTVAGTATAGGSRSSARPPPCESRPGSPPSVTRALWASRSANWSRVGRVRNRRRHRQHLVQERLTVVRPVKIHARRRPIEQELQIRLRPGQPFDVRPAARTSG